VSNFNYNTFASDGTVDLECKTSNYMKDYNPHYWKQCFCEMRPRHEPRFCAIENQECKQCSGNVVYGQAVIEGKKTDFETMLTKNYAVLNIQGGASNVGCNNKVLGDPIVGQPKHCFCDDVGFLTEDRILADQAFFENAFMLDERERQAALLEV